MENGLILEIYQNIIRHKILTMTIYKNIPIIKVIIQWTLTKEIINLKNKSRLEKEYNVYRKIGSNTQNLKPFQKPSLVDIELASICNLKCPCVIQLVTNLKNVSATRMNFDLFKKIIDEIKGKTPAIRLSLRGEATLNKDFTKCIKNMQKIMELKKYPH